MERETNNILFDTDSFDLPENRSCDFLARSILRDGDFQDLFKVLPGRNNGNVVF